MPSLFSAMHTAAESLRTYERSLSVVQNNVTNASTPGYARQIVDLVALNFQPDLNLPGGVGISDNVSSRSASTEQTVRAQSERYGRQAQLATGLSQVEPVFDISEGAGISGALSRLYSAFSQLSVTPNDLPSRENVIGRAKDVANTFNSTASSLATAAENNAREVRGSVEKINRLATVISNLNEELSKDFRNQTDAGLDARMHAALEELSELVGFNALREDNGSVTVLLGGQTSLVLGKNAYQISADFSGPNVEIRDSTGGAVTSQVTEGRLAGMLELANKLIPSYGADLDQLASAFGQRVNDILAAGVDLNGQSPTVGLFANFGSASTMSVTAMTPQEIAAAYATAPGGNGNALDLTGLVNSPEIGSFTFTEFYGQIGARLGRSLSTAQEDQHSQALLVAQARTLREELSGVNLDEEAANLIQYQRAYQAAAQMITVLNQLTEEIFTMLR